MGPNRFGLAAMLTASLATFSMASGQEQRPTSLCLDHREVVIAVGAVHAKPGGRIISEMPDDGGLIIIDGWFILDDSASGGQKWAMVLSDNGSAIGWIEWRNVRRHVATPPCLPKSN